MKDGVVRPTALQGLIMDAYREQAIRIAAASFGKVLG
jgi:hypothetical protein